MTVPLIDKLDINAVNDTITRINENLTPSNTPSAQPAPAPSGGSLLIWEKLIDKSPLKAVTTDGEVTLDGKAHGGYWIEIIIYNPGAAATYRLYYNNDTTNTNYYTIRPGVANLNDAYITFNGGSQATGVTGFWTGGVQISPEGFIRSYMDEWETTFFGTPLSHHKIIKVPNLTRIDIVSSVVGGIGINSLFRLWRRK